LITLILTQMPKW